MRLGVAAAVGETVVGAPETTRGATATFDDEPMSTTADAASPSARTTAAIATVLRRGRVGPGDAPAMCIYRPSAWAYSSGRCTGFEEQGGGFPGEDDPQRAIR